MELKIGNRTFRPFLSDPPERKKTLKRYVIAQYGSQAKAARAWGVWDSDVSHWVRGERAVPDWVFEKLGITRDEVET